MEGGGRRQGIAVSLRHELLSFPLSARLHLLKHSPHGLCLSLLSRLGEGMRECGGESGCKDLVRVGGGEEQGPFPTALPSLFFSLGHLHLRLSHCSPPDLPERDTHGHRKANTQHHCVGTSNQAHCEGGTLGLLSGEQNRILGQLKVIAVNMLLILEEKKNNF